MSTPIEELCKGYPGEWYHDWWTHVFAMGILSFVMLK
jgi:hypothetical protein